MEKIQKHLTLWVLIAGVMGYFLSVALGDPAWVGSEHPPELYRLILLLKSLFIKALKMMIAPLIFFSLLGGILNLSKARSLKRLSTTTFIYYFATSGIAILIGLFVVFFIHPWESSDTHQLLLESVNQLESSSSRLIGGEGKSFVLIWEKLLGRMLDPPFVSFAENNILGIVFLAVIFGIALLKTVPKGSPLILCVAHTNDCLNKVLSWIILFAPVGIFAILFDFQLKTGGTLIVQLIGFGLVVLGATAVHGGIVLPAIAYFFGGVPPLELFKKISRPMLIAFGTASSTATLPVTMKTAEDEFNLDAEVAGFVLPLGATVNMDGTALFEGIAAVFLAHIYGLNFGGAEIIAVFLMAMISSIGSPGMPSGSMSGMQMVMLAIGIPLEAIGLLLIIERPLDTFRTAVNVEGDIIGGIVAQKFLNKQRSKLTD